MPDTPVHPPGPLLTVPAGICAVAGLVLGLVPGIVNADAQSYAAPTRPGRSSTSSRCGTASGLPLLLSALALVVGYGLHRAWGTVGRLAGRSPAALSAQRGYEVAIGGTERLATAVTARLQAGSVPAYLTVILVVVILLPGLATLIGGHVAGPAPLPCGAAVPARRRWCCSPRWR